MKKKEKAAPLVSKISYSGISMYLRCPRQYYFRYVLGQKEAPSIALTEGSAHHEALEYNNNHKMKKGRDLAHTVITEKFVETLRTKVAEENVSYEEESEDTLIERGQIWHRKYMQNFAPAIEPTSVEQEHQKEITLNGRPMIFHAFTDYTEKNKVSDYKTCSAFRFNMFMKREIDNDLQLTFYSWLSKLKKVAQMCFVKGTTPEVKPLESSRTVGQVAWALEIANSVIKSIDMGSFPTCPPTQWNCNKKYCGYWDQCRGKVEG